MERYDRHLKIKDFSIDDQTKLQKASILMVGAGGLGSPILQYLIGVGIGKITLFEPDIVSLDNLPRQILYNEDQIGEKKGEIVEALAQQKNSEIELTCFKEKFNPEKVREISFDLIICSPDNYDARVQTDAFAQETKTDIVHGAVQEYGGHLLSIGANQKLRYTDIFPEPTQPTANSKGIIGPVAGIVGSYMALEAINIIRNIGKDLRGKILWLDTEKFEQRIFNIEK